MVPTAPDWPARVGQGPVLAQNAFWGPWRSSEGRAPWDQIEEGNNETFGAGIFILEVRNGSPAYHGGVQIGDMLLAVNMCDLLGASREFAAELIRRIDGEIMMKLFRQRIDKDEKLDGSLLTILRG